MPRGFGQTTAAMAGIGGREGAHRHPQRSRLRRAGVWIRRGGRFTVWDSCDSHGGSRASAARVPFCGHAARPPVVGRATMMYSAETGRMLSTIDWFLFGIGLLMLMVMLIGHHPRSRAWSTPPLHGHGVPRLLSLSSREDRRQESARQRSLASPKSPRAAERRLSSGYRPTFGV